MKDDTVYLLNDNKDNFQDQLLENVLDDDNRNDENVEKYILLTSELIQKDKIIEIMKNNIKKWRVTYRKTKEIGDVSIGRDISQN